MNKEIEFYYVTGNIIDLVYLVDQKINFKYRELHEKFNVLCIKIKDKFYSLDGDIIFNDIERTKLNKIKRTEIKKIVTKLGQYHVIKKVHHNKPTEEEINKAIVIIDKYLNKEEDKSNLIGFPFENIGPIFKITNHKVLEFTKKR